MALDPGVIESVINSNFKAISEQVTTNMLAHQNRLNIMAEKALGNTLMSMDSTQVDVSEALGTKTVAESGLAAQISALSAALTSALAQLQKAP